MEKNAIAAPPPAETPTLIRATWLVSLFTLFSRILGLLRDKALVLVFGGSAWVLDSFILAFTIPNLFRRLLGEGALTAAFVPEFVGALEQDGRERANALADSVFTLLTLVTALLATLGIVGCLGARESLDISPKIALTLKLTALMLPFLLFVCVSALLGAMLQSLRSFVLPAAMSCVLNLAMIAALVFIYYHGGLKADTETVTYVAWGVLLAGAAQFVLQWPALARFGLWLRPRWDVKDARVRAVLKAMLPTALGLGVVQINVLIDNLLAYWLSLSGQPGATTYLYLGNRLMQLPLGIFGIAVATTSFPLLASYLARGEHRKCLDSLHDSLRFVLFIMLPSAVGLGLLAEPVIRMIYQEPDLTFSDAAVYRSSAVLVCYAAGLPFFSLQHLLARVFFARKDYSTPVRISAFMVVVNLALNLLLIQAPDLYQRWAHVTIDGLPAGRTLGEAGLALATTITAIINVLLLWFCLRGEFRKQVSLEEWEKRSAASHWAVARLAFAAALMGVSVYYIQASIPAEPELIMRLERGLVPVVSGLAAYIIACLVIPVPELEEFLWARRKGKKPDDAGRAPEA